MERRASLCVEYLVVCRVAGHDGPGFVPKGILEIIRLYESPTHNIGADTGMILQPKIL